VTEGTHLPVDVLNENMRRIGRTFDGAVFIWQGWQDGEYGLRYVWPDGFVAFVGFGPEASAIIERWVREQH